MDFLKAEIIIGQTDLNKVIKKTHTIQPIYPTKQAWDFSLVPRPVTVNP